MSVAMTKADGVTVFTLTSDPQSPWPPLCQILKGFCYSPVCCSVSQNLRRVQRASQSVLGALHIMVGLLNIGLGAILCSSDLPSVYAYPYWLGGMFILFGITGILSEKFPSPCLVVVNVILDLAGVGFAIAAVVLYSINVFVMRLRLMLDREDNEFYQQHTTAPPAEEILWEKIWEGKELTMVLLRSINGVLIVLSVLEICLAVSSAVVGIKALRSNEKTQNQNQNQVEKTPTRPSV
ncbi:membrane-spanning 4-domains subfamily A member 6C-like isoform X1 [Embiotoca jacksoni]|uniref:membrane-spanning 4-domains subfamily A member 6C-like isoform X1 n=1 Tax=Embiotoca jacksoni TaxID=100190 RepID=UPI0037049504